ncbi:MAG TPA: peptidase [Candidatus Scatomonas merdigallinarum]|nr:peptidase [Candidatus Scatomonas merdigallinarum]
MAKKIKKFITKIFSQRVIVLGAVFLAMSSILIVRLFQLQIVNGEEYADNFTILSTKERQLKSTRGNIYDCNGKLLAYNELSNSVTLEDNGTYDSTRERNLSLNGEIYRLVRLIESCGDTVTNDFHIIVDESGNFAFDLEEGTTSLDRFRADIYGRRTIDELEAEEKNATAEDIMEYLSGSQRFALRITDGEDKPYTAEELAEHGLPSEFTPEEELKVVTIRYLLYQTSFQRYLQVTIASNVSDETVAAVYENQDQLPGVDIAEDSIRVYNNAESMSSIIGYTGSASQEELDELSEIRDDYENTSVIGKTGIEQYMETTLKGTDGHEEVTVDTVGRVLSVREDSRVEPVQGNDVYLTIDSELQEACYQILEQRIAGILVANLMDIKTVEGMENVNSDNFPVPIYDVYVALIENSVIDINHFTEAGASATEQWVQQVFEKKQQEVLDSIRGQLEEDSSVPYRELSEEMQEYVDYIVEDMLTEDAGILNADAIDTSDSVYRQWSEDQSISLQEYLSYAASQNWVDVGKLSQSDAYLDSSQVYQAITEYVLAEIPQDTWFSKIIYKYLIMEDQISGEDVCTLLYDQGVLSTEDEAYTSFQEGKLSPFDLLRQKIISLEITPAQLALDPCSGSIVVVDPDTGEVKAMVSYPGYDNNRLANQMDTEYYYQLYEDLSTPFYNKATQQLTAPGSTFKPVTIVAGLNEGVIDNDTVINCNGLFGEGLVDKGDQLHCWLLSGHGNLDVVGAIENSCNVFLCTTAYLLGLDADGNFSQNAALEKLQQYASLFDLDQKTGVQITESSPHVSDAMGLPSAIGQGTHQYTTAQLARYVSTIYNSGTSYELNLLDKVTDSEGNTVEEFSPKVSKQMNVEDWIWEDVHEGMRRMIQSSGTLQSLPLELYGKSGTAQESESRPNHGLFIGYAKNGGQEDIAFATRIAFGYSSTNAAVVAKDLLNYYYNLQEETEILTGEAMQNGLSTTHFD